MFSPHDQGVAELEHPSSLQLAADTPNRDPPQVSGGGGVRAAPRPYRAASPYCSDPLAGFSPPTLRDSNLCRLVPTLR